MRYIVSVKLMVSFDVKEDKISEFLALLQNAKTALAGEPGCHDVEVLQSTEAPGRIMLVEVWDSQEIHDRYAEKMQQAGAMEHMATFLNAEQKAEFFLFK